MNNKIMNVANEQLVCDTCGKPLTNDIEITYSRSLGRFYCCKQCADTDYAQYLDKVENTNNATKFVCSQCGNMVSNQRSVVLKELEMKFCSSICAMEYAYEYLQSKTLEESDYPQETLHEEQE